MPYFLGLDIGTTSTKANAFDRSGKMLCESIHGYALEEPESGAAVQSADAIVEAAEQSVRAVVGQLGSDPEAIGLSVAMHSLLLVDDQGKCLSPVYTWADTRAQAAAEALNNAEIGPAIYRRTGTPIHAMSPLVKIKWLQDSRPDLIQQTARFADIKSYLLFCWFDCWKIDQSVASATGMYHLEERQWDAKALEYLGIEPAQLATVVDGLELLTNWNPDLKDRLGLSSDVPLAIGLSDGSAANLGAGVLEPPHAVLTIGTSGAIRMTTQSAQVDTAHRLFTYILQGNHYIVGGASNNGGKVLEWFCQAFFPDRSYAELIELGADVPAGAEGLRCLPYLYGERAPVYQPEATARFEGLRSHHRPAHFVRAILEGILYNLCESIDALEETVAPIDTLYANGGFTRSKFWVQLLADISGLPVHIAETPQASSYGAALLARRAVGDLADWSDLKGQITTDNRFEPNPKIVARYRKLREAWREAFCT